jgi:hypothetical protein
METITTHHLKREFVAENISIIILIIGLYVLGIPHGALDNYLTITPLDTLFKKLSFMFST